LVRTLGVVDQSQAPPAAVFKSATFTNEVSPYGWAQTETS
jgi:hypothetical protein